jgi:hypothetical protein
MREREMFKRAREDAMAAFRSLHCTRKRDAGHNNVVKALIESAVFTFAQLELNI